MGKHDPPRTGSGKPGGHGPKPPRSQVSITTSTGAMLWKATASLFKGKKDGKK